MNSKYLNLFLKIGIAEAVSFLLLLLVAMPMKYYFGLPMTVTYVGWVHGLLFVLYIIFLLLAAAEQNWDFKTCSIAFFASLVPFGPFLFERKLKTANQVEK